MNSTSLLLGFHERHPGAAGQVFGNATCSAGRNGYRWLADLVEPEQHRSVLDLGCGDGLLLKELQQLYEDQLELTGLDLSPHELALAKAVPKVQLLEASAANIPVADSSFDAVLCHMAFMLMDPLDQVVGELERVLRPGGLFAAVVGRSQATPNSTLVFSMVKRLAKEDGLHQLQLGDPRYSADSMADFFEEDRWEQVRMQDFSLQVEVPLKEFIGFLLRAYYWVDLLSFPKKKALAQHIGRIRSALAPEGVVHWTFPRRLLTAVRR